MLPIGGLESYCACSMNRRLPPWPMALIMGAEGVHAIYDLGGGTFDISILRLHQGRV
jgi:hypothetical protein